MKTTYFISAERSFSGPYGPAVAKVNSILVDCEIPPSDPFFLRSAITKVADSADWPFGEVIIISMSVLSTAED